MAPAGSSEVAATIIDTPTNPHVGGHNATAPRIVRTDPIVQAKAHQHSPAPYAVFYTWNTRSALMATSPCTGTCELRDGVCTDCNRTIEDIMHWSEMTEEQRKERMDELRTE
jgi:predicted Fe-S protein YdhL (DUF1289 family)